MLSVRLYKNNKQKIVNAQFMPLLNGDFKFSIGADEIGFGWEYADVFYDAFKANENDKGYYLLPELAGGRLVRFKKTKSGGTFVSDKSSLRMIGCIINGTGFVGKITGMSDEYRLVCTEDNDEYRY